jgi:hypothetical protein
LALSSHGQRSFGSFATPNERYTVNSYALTLQHLDAITEPGSPELGPALGQVTLRAASAIPGRPIFIGVAPQSDVSAYLAGVPHSELVEVKFDPFRPHYRETVGSGQPHPANEQSFWTSSAQGQGTQQIQVDLRHGSWAVVVMNADGHPAVAADLQAEVTLPWFGMVTRGVLLAGVLLLTIGAALLLIGASNLTRRNAGS